MNGALRVLRGEVRRLLPLLLAMGVVTAVLIWAHPSDWGTRWNSLGATLREAVIVIGPACVVVGVWCGGRVRRAAMGELLASTRRSALGRVSVDLVALVVVLYLGVLLGWASAAWTIVVVGGYGTWVAVWFVLGLLPVVAAYTAVGYAVGRLVPWRIAAPVAGLATYVGFGFGVYSDDRLEQAFGSGVIGGVNGYALLADVLVWSAAGLMLIAVAFAALSGAERRPAAGRWGTAVTGVAVATAVVPFALIATQPSVRPPEVLADDPTVCSLSGGLRVCVPMEQQHVLGVAARQARAVARRFGEEAGAPTRAAAFRNRSLEPGTIAIGSNGITPWGRPASERFSVPLPDAQGYLDPYYYCAAARRSGSQNELENVAQDAGVPAAGSWLSGDPLPVDPTSSLIDRRFAAASRLEKQRFAGRLALAAQSCDARALREAANLLPPRPLS